MKVVKITVDNEISIVDVSEQEGLIGALQKELDGFMEVVRAYGLRTINKLLSEETGHEERLVMLVDEDGRCKFKKINVVGSILYHGNIAGDILFIKEAYIEGRGYDLAPLTEEEATEAYRLFKYLFNNLKDNMEVKDNGTDGI